MFFWTCRRIHKYTKDGCKVCFCSRLFVWVLVSGKGVSYYRSCGWDHILANLGLFSLILFVASCFHLDQYLHKKNMVSKWYSAGVVVWVLRLIVWFQWKKLFLFLWITWTHIIYEFRYYEFSMNSCIFCTLNIWIHTNMNSYNVWIHIFLYEFSMNSYIFAL